MIFSPRLKPALPVIWLVLALPVQASRWVELGNAGVTTDKVMVDLDSVQKSDALRIASVMTLYAAPRENQNHVLLDRRVQKVAFDCAAHTFAGIRVFGFMGEKQVGSSPESTDWRNNMRPMGDNPLNKRAFDAVCGVPIAGDAGQPQKPKTTYGSGIVVDGSGGILTANHVVKNCRSVQVKSSDSRALEATVAAVDPRKTPRPSASRRAFAARRCPRSSASRWESSVIR